MSPELVAVISVGIGLAGIMIGAVTLAWRVFSSMKDELRTDIAGIKTDLRQELNNMEGRVREDVKELRGWVFSGRSPEPPADFEKARRRFQGNG